MKFSFLFSILAFLGLGFSSSAQAVHVQFDNGAVGISQYKAEKIRETIRANRQLLEGLNINTVWFGRDLGQYGSHVNGSHWDVMRGGRLDLESDNFRNSVEVTEKRLDLLLWGLREAKVDNIYLVVEPDWRELRDPVSNEYKGTYIAVSETKASALRLLSAVRSGDIADRLEKCGVRQIRLRYQGNRRSRMNWVERSQTWQLVLRHSDDPNTYPEELESRLVDEGC